MSESKPVRVAIVDDHSIVRKGLSAILNTSQQLQLVGEAEDGQEAIELCELAQPDVVLMDLIMPGMDGIEATRIIHQRWPHIQVLVLTSFTDKEMIQGALDAGANGYLLKNVRGRELVDAIIQVHAGGQTISQEAQQSLNISEQLVALEKEINDQRVSTSTITESLNKRLPNLFPHYQIQILSYPDRILHSSPDQLLAPIPDLGWDWLRTTGKTKLFFHGEELPWNERQTWGHVLLLKPILSSDRNRPLGGISLFSQEKVSDTGDLLASANALADILASALDQGFVEPVLPDGARASDELQMAGRLQSRILPENPPQLKGWDLAARLLPARETSGDFYDFIPLANDKWGILIADVTDKGFGAAVFMAMCSALIRTYTVRFPTLPALALSSVNERIFTDMRGGLFLTAFYGILEPQVGRMRYVNAGHNPPILLSNKKGKPVDKLSPTGMALGVEEHTNWQQKVLKFSPGEVLLMYTDGITEAQNRAGSFYSEARLERIFRENRQVPAAEILNKILSDVNQFTQNAPDQDDMALVVISRKG